MITPTTYSAPAAAVMAATRASTSATALSVSVHSVVRGHHVYKKIWTPYVGQMLALQQEIGNVHDRFAVAVMAQPAATIVGRVPREFSMLDCQRLVRSLCFCCSCHDCATVYVRNKLYRIT